MAYSEIGLTHGGIAFLKQTTTSMVTNNWVEFDSISDVDLGTAPIVQSETIELGLSVVGFPLSTDIPLSVMFITDYTVQKDWTTPAVENTDYSMNRVNGTMRLLPGGIFDSGGVGIGVFGILPGYNIRRGWKVYGSDGISTQEDLFVGCYFTSKTGNAAAPVKTGMRWKIFSAYTVGDDGPIGAPAANKNDDSEDVISLISPNSDWIYRASTNADRSIFFGKSDCESAWGYVGGLTRLRPVTEQALIVAMCGSTSAADLDSEGIIGKTNEFGQMGMNQGSVYLYDVATFSDSGNPIQLNANAWSNEVGSLSQGFTPSRLQVTPHTPGTGAQKNYYFELHEAFAGRNIQTVNDSTNVLFGAWDQILLVLAYQARDNVQLTWQGQNYRLWAVGSDNERFVAVAEV